MTVNDHQTVLVTTVFNLVAPAGVLAPVGVELRYDSRNPYEVGIKFNVGRTGQVDWVVARELVADGLVVDSGHGDVRIRPRRDVSGLVVIALSSPSGQATFEADADELMEFLNDTYDVVAPGEEHKWMSIDDALSRLLPHDM
ncbi:SsgA family sporulation/cell division regulator [Saccharopolyspora phatthalungensis]|uniref:Sporulation protein SsgA n=1 Tax=Saccharopolyspora phatthalungensis TaxID=664693 RepID=A0A840QD05_9PSEU|nr:SsgA family sporulation/cell division regulator [Saccharopolyspora phatthalungensis]MBB5158634.1 hypothetical protein [Saccharopolyspora phatthalungensis]